MGTKIRVLLLRQKVGMDTEEAKPTSESDRGKLNVMKIKQGHSSVARCIAGYGLKPEVSPPLVRKEAWSVFQLVVETLRDVI